MPRGPCSHCALITTDGQWACADGSCPGFVALCGCGYKQLCQRQDLPDSLRSANSYAVSETHLMATTSCCQPLTWTHNLLTQQCNFTLSSGCIWSKGSPEVQIGYPTMFKQGGKSVSSFSNPLLTTCDKTSQHL